MDTQKLFISYSWTNPDHEAWVLQLATELRESSVDVILDKWDLKEGHDSHAFMEKMVTDPQIQKVALVCDRVYAEKADGRSGGVGTEAQIISAEIYAKRDQDKFVALVKERDENGKPYLPTYYRGRIFIDLSDPVSYAESFDKLLRWVFDKPLYLKPALGPPPSFLVEQGDEVILQISGRFRRALEALRNSRPHAVPATREYLTQLALGLENLRIRMREGATDFDDAVIHSINSFLQYRNQMLEIFSTLAIYADSTETRRVVHRFFEQLIPYLDRPEDAAAYSTWDFDNYRFIIHELFLLCMAAFIRHERFETADYLMAHHYHDPSQANRGHEVMISYEIFRWEVSSLSHRQSRLNLDLLSLRSDLLKQRAEASGLEFRYIMQADFILYLRSLLEPGRRWWWMPDTLQYVGWNPTVFEVFARSQSTSYFNQAKILLGIASKEQLLPLFEAMANNRLPIPQWGPFHSIAPGRLLGFNELATKP